jgi:hypothetical protein
MNILSIVDQTMTTQYGNSTSQIKPHPKLNDMHAVSYVIKQGKAFP